MADPNAVPTIPASADPADMTGQYDTPLNPVAREAYGKWLADPTILGPQPGGSTIAPTKTYLPKPKKRPKPKKKER